MPKLSEVLSGEATIPVFFGDVELTITYDPNEYTADAEARWREADKEGKAAGLAVDFVASLVKRWDLQEDETGKTVSLDEKRLGTVSTLVLDAVIGAIFEDVSKSGKGQNRAERRAKKHS